MTTEELDVIYQIRQALGVGAKPMLSELPDICRKLREENRELKSHPDMRTFVGWESGMRTAAATAKGIKAPASIGKDKGRHHEAGAQAAAKAILEAIGE